MAQDTLKNSVIAQPSQEELDAFVAAASGGSTPGVADFLDKYPTAINKTDEKGWTALISAAREGRIDVVGMLLERGASPDKQMGFGWTALMLAAGNGNRGSMLLLLEHGASVFEEADNGDTALTWAQEKNQTEMATILEEWAVKQEKALRENWLKKTDCSLGLTHDIPATRPLIVSPRKGMKP